MGQNVAILLARLDSKRLPGKHFKRIGDKFLIDHCFDRLKKGTNYTVVLATSDREVDLPLIEWAKHNQINYYAGDGLDLRKRIEGCVDEFKANYFARVNADSPFISSDLIDEGFKILNNSDYEIVTNLFPRTYPYGYSVEIFKTSTFLRNIYFNSERENITTYFYKNAERFRIKNLQLLNENFSDIQLTIDTPEDLEYFRNLFLDHNNLFDLSLNQLMEIVKNKKTND